MERRWVPVRGDDDGTPLGPSVRGDDDMTEKTSHGQEHVLGADDQFHIEDDPIDLPMNSVYSVCMFGFACAAVRSVQVAIRHWRQGYSVLERPESAITETI